MRKGFTEKALTKQLAVKLETEANMRRMGLIDSELEEQAERKKDDLRQHLKSYRKSLFAKKNTKKHVQLTIRRIERIIEGCRFTTLGDLDLGPHCGDVVRVAAGGDGGGRPGA